jgi:hypothetical protein
MYLTVATRGCEQGMNRITMQPRNIEGNLFKNTFRHFSLLLSAVLFTGLTALYRHLYILQMIIVPIF